MNIPGFSVQRPVFTTMAALIVMILGGIALSRLPVDLMPDISWPTLSVTTSYENASPEDVETLITRLIEEAMSAVPGVEEVSSVSGEGSSNVRVTFAWGTDLDAAANDIRDRLDRVVQRLPDDATRPALRKFDPAAFPIIILGAASRMDPIHMRRLIDEDIKPRIERVPGVAAVDVWGGLEREIHVNIDPDKLSLLKIPIELLVRNIQTANITLPAGYIEEGTYEITLRTPGEFRSLEELEKTTVALRHGVPIRLRDVAEVTDHWRRVTRVVRVNGQPGVRISINKQSGVNTVEVARRVLAEVDLINQELQQIRLTSVVDSSEFIQRSISHVQMAALYGGIFAMLIVFLFLRSLRGTAIIGVAIPLSIIGTFTMIYFGGFTLNIMTMGGLALGVGMLLDNAIVVLENIYRHRKESSEPDKAAVNGASEVSGAIFASTMTTLAVFLPMIFIRGMSGIMFRQLAYVVGFSLLCSLGAALTVIPMLSARLFRFTGTTPFKPNVCNSNSQNLFARLEKTYLRLLHTTLEHRIWTVLGAMALLGCSLILIPLVGVELMPQSDEGEIRLNVEMDVGTRLAEVDKVLQYIEKVVDREVPEMRNAVVSVGGPHWRAGGSHIGNMRISLTPRSKRRRSSDEVAAVLRRQLSNIPGAIVRVRTTQGFFMMRRLGGGEERVEVEIRGHDLEISDRLARRVSNIIEQIPNVTDTQISREIGVPERMIRVDRIKAESMNVSVRQIADFLQSAMSGKRAGVYRDGGEEVAIRVKFKDAERMLLRDILNFNVMREDGRKVALRNIVSVESGDGPVRIERRNQERVVTVRANIADRDTGSIMADIRNALRDFPIPPGFAIVYGGDFEEQQEAFKELAVALILALILVYMVMACLYESLRDPFVVMFSVPLAIIGVILMLFMTGTTFNVQSYIGCIMLGGIVVNNAILLVDTANSLRRRNDLTLRAAIEEASRRRLRPILMTTLTTIGGLFPLALGWGEGGEAQAPMARAVIGGLLSSSLVTLVFVPVIYTIFGKKHNDK